MRSFENARKRAEFQLFKHCFGPEGSRNLFGSMKAGGCASAASIGGAALRAVDFGSTYGDLLDIPRPIES